MRFLTVSLALLLLATLSIPPAHARSVEYRYVDVPGVPAPCDPSLGVGTSDICLAIQPGETWAHVRLADATGAPVRVYWSYAGSGGLPWGHFCNEGEIPLTIQGTVILSFVPATADCPGLGGLTGFPAATTGVATVTFR